ncbi:MAG: tetratricopeptide repeat protein [Candidatus Eisenbacteria bacterium]|nr:tetratricopeptide repeat protein [Candidatus Eisenbacteria bacterium]
MRGTGLRTRAAWFGGATTVLGVLLTLGCGGGGGGGGGTGPTNEDLAAEYTADGWDAFEQGNYAAARGHFEDALEKVGTYGQAYLGLGWCQAAAGEYLSAKTSFDQAISNGVTGADPYAGKAAALRDANPPDYSGTISAASAALSAAPTYQFSHDTSFDWRDLRLIMAQCYFALGEYESANEQVGLLGGDEQDEQSPTFVENLLAELENLGSAIRS